MAVFEITIRQMVPEKKVVTIEAYDAEEASDRVHESGEFDDGDGFEFDGQAGIQKRWVDEVIQTHLTVLTLEEVGRDALGGQ